jgi:hypothetical protein
MPAHPHAVARLRERPFQVTIFEPTVVVAAETAKELAEFILWRVIPKQLERLVQFCSNGGSNMGR